MRHEPNKVPLNEILCQGTGPLYERDAMRHKKSHHFLLSDAALEISGGGINDWVGCLGRRRFI